MYTLYKDHLTWQQTCRHETRDKLRYKLKKDKVYYDPFENENYLKEMEAIKMKKFYGKHLNQYMTNVDGEADDGVFRKTRFAPLAVTGFNTTNGWASNSVRRSGSMVVEQRKFGASGKNRDKSVNDDVMRLTNENFKLTSKLNELQDKLKSNNMNLEDVASVAPTSVFKRIAQRALEPEKKIKLMYGQPCDVKPTGFVDASFKDKKHDEWAESKMKKAMLEQGQISTAKHQLEQLSNQIEAEKQKRLEI